MNYRMLFYLLGIIMLIEAGLLLLPMAVAAVCGESILPFALTVIVLTAISIPAVVKKPKNTRIYAREGYICVALSWILMSLFGALPFLISQTIPSYIDCIFETVSGFTTTGASILTDVQVLPRGILFWRSLTHWIGGMGVLVFVLAILPSTGRGIHLLRAEVPGPTKGKLVPKLRQTAMILYGIYIALTVTQIIALLLCDLPLYDSVVTSFATAGTGGFSVLNESIAGYNNPAAEWVIGIFMLLFGINFNLYYLVLIKKGREALKNEELRVYLALFVVSVGAIILNTASLYGSIEETVRHSVFQVSTIMTTTGFATVDFNLWPELSRTILVLLMIIGACAGSTAGGLKVSRVLILVKNAVREIKHMIRPKSVNVIRLDGEVVPEETVKGAGNFFTLYVSIIALSVLLVSTDGFTFDTTLTSVIACVNNIGPGLDAVGPMGNYSQFSVLSKIVLSLNMLFGRLEIMPMIVLCSPFAWKK